jgi:hypothetical protein
MAQKMEIQVIDDKLLIEGILDERNGIENNDPSKGDFNLVDIAPTVEKISLSFKVLKPIKILFKFPLIEFVENWKN